MTELKVRLNLHWKGETEQVKSAILYAGSIMLGAVRPNYVEEDAEECPTCGHVHEEGRPKTWIDGYRAMMGVNDYGPSIGKFTSMEKGKKVLLKRVEKELLVESEEGSER